MPKKKTQRLPVLPLRGLMVFPHMVLHFDVGRKRSLSALENALVEDQLVFLVCQHDAGEEDPQADDLYAVGTVSRIKQALKLPGDSVRVLVEGLYRAKLVRLSEEEGFLSADVAVMQDTMREGESEMAALLRATQNYFEAYAKASGRIPAETLTSVLSVEDPAQLADILAANVLTRIDDRQRILELRDVGDRLEALCAILDREYACALGLLSRERDRLERLAKALLEQEQMDLQAVLAAI